MLGIAVAKSSNKDENNNNGNAVVVPGVTSATNTNVLLYYTESGGGKDGDDAPNNTTGANTSKAGNIQPAGNRLYRYDLDLDNNKLTNSVLLLNLPASLLPQRPDIERQHMCCKVLIDPDNNVYVGIDDVGGHNGQIQNNPNGIAPYGTSGILRVTQDGQINK